jgi:hypothetical protein
VAPHAAVLVPQSVGPQTGGVHWHTCAVLQNWPAPHVPVHVPLQPSEAPQALPAQLGVQPQTLAVPPPPQVLGEVQLPDEQTPPQPLEAPQALPAQLGMQHEPEPLAPTHWPPAEVHAAQLT